MTAVREDMEVDDGEIDDWVSPGETELGEWEKQSIPLTVPESYQGTFEVFQDHMEVSKDRIGDGTLDQELEILESLNKQQT